jgi:diguanylate cyclase (GGDEF)-like protein/PAS domain S-box-containing protein
VAYLGLSFVLLLLSGLIVFLVYRQSVEVAEGSRLREQARQIGHTIDMMNTGIERFSRTGAWAYLATSTHDQAIAEFRALKEQATIAAIPAAHMEHLELAATLLADSETTRSRVVRLLTKAEGLDDSQLPPSIAEISLSEEDANLSAPLQRQLAGRLLESGSYERSQLSLLAALENFYQSARILYEENEKGRRTVINLLAILLFCVSISTAAYPILDRQRRLRTEDYTRHVVELGENLGAVTSATEAARFIAEAADRIIGWDSCSVALYDATSDSMSLILMVDNVDGKRTDVTMKRTMAATVFNRSVIFEGPQLILRKAGDTPAGHMRPFGNESRPSLSLIYVPMRRRGQAIGLLTIQSYQAGRYGSNDVQDLQWLADRCAAALERANLHEALHESEERYRILVENSLDGVYLIDSTRILYCNSAYARIFGYDSPAELIGKLSVLDLIAPEDRELMREGIDRRISGNAPGEHFSFAGIRRDGSRVNCEVLGTPFNYNGDTVVLGTLRDVSEREQAEQEIHKTHELYSRAIEAAGAVPYRLDYSTGNYEFPGNEIEDITGFGAAELDQKAFEGRTLTHRILSPSADLSEQERIAKLHSGEIETYRGELEFERKDGGRIWLSDASITERDQTGKVVGSLGILMDITERKRTEVRATAFASLGERLNEATSGAEAARVVAETANQLFPWDSCSIRLYDPRNDTFIDMHSQDVVDGMRCQITEPGDITRPSATARRVLKGESILVLRAPGEMPSPDLTGFGTTNTISASLMFAPIRHLGRVLGIAAFHSYRLNAFTPHDLEDLQALADHCAAGIERAQLYDSLKHSEEQLRTIWDNTGSGMRLTDSEGIMQMVNPAFCELVEMDEEELVGKPMAVIYAPDMVERVTAQYKRRFAERSVDNVLMRNMVLWNGKTITFEIANRFVTTVEGPTLLGVINDRTVQHALEEELRRANKELELQATVDSLTSLSNRRHILETLHREAARATRYRLLLSFLMVDLDHFKSVNDTHGHLAGDMVLARVGRVIQNNIREMDSAGRYGGEEFCVVMPETGLPGALTIADRLRRRLAEEIFTTPDGIEFRVTCSIGAAQCDLHTTNVNALLQEADNALYRAKDAGRNRVSA